MFLFDCLTFAVYSRLCRSGKFDGFLYFLIVFKEFDCIPSLLVFCDGFRKDILHISDSCFHFFGEDFFWKISAALLCCFDCFVDQFVKTFALQCGCLNDRAVKQHGKTLNIDLDSSFFKKVCHVQRDDNRNTGLNKLSGQIQVTLDVCCIDKIDDNIWVLFQDIVTADYLFQSVW